jgi:hypothetical protein
MDARDQQMNIPPLNCPEWAAKTGQWQEPDKGNQCTCCGMPIWEHIPSSDPKLLVQHAAILHPQRNVWIPYPWDSTRALNIETTIEEGSTRRRARVICTKPGHIMLGQPA